MRKYLKIVLIVFLIAGITSACKKSSSDSPKDAAASIKDKTWWGKITYTGKTGEYFSVHFNTDKSLVWNQLSGEYTGQWSINGKKLTIIFISSGVQITADISEDNKLLNIEDNAGSYDINSGELIANPNPTLDNTVWKGSYFNGGSQQPIQLSFLPGSVLTANFGALPAQVVTYTRSSSGSVIRYGTGGMYPFFAVITSGSEIKGSTTSSTYPLLALKQ